MRTILVCTLYSIKYGNYGHFNFVPAPVYLTGGAPAPGEVPVAAGAAVEAVRPRGRPGRIQHRQEVRRQNPGDPRVHRPPGVRLIKPVLFVADGGTNKLECFVPGNFFCLFNICG